MNRYKIDIVKLKMFRERKISYANESIVNPASLAKVGFKFLGKADREIMAVVCLNAKNHINCISVVSIGNLFSNHVNPREVFKIAILSNSAAIALIHNHPSGSTEPSINDIEITRRLIKCGDLLGIPVIDHLIIGDRNYLSFKEKGILNFEGKK